LIGCISLKRHDAGSSVAELAYWFGVPHWGRGFATDAGLAFLDEVAREWRLNTVWVGVLHGNARSIRVREKLGMLTAGFIRGHPVKSVFISCAMQSRARVLAANEKRCRYGGSKRGADRGRPVKRAISGSVRRLLAPGRTSMSGS
jgi:RimJ/RimL family protein N-acetyltransferase